MKKACVIILITFCVTCAAMVNSCSKRSDLSARVPLVFVTPAGFPQAVYRFENNALTQQGFNLGKKLFYDGQLSKDGNFPCASCHQQFAAFATFDHDLSHGFNNQFTTRNTPALQNLAWLKEFQWDGGVNHIEVQPLANITATNEMAEDIANVVNKLKRDVAYPPLFAAAFGDTAINTQRILRALAQFTASLVSANSKYDKMTRGETSFNSAEQQGYVLFKGKCASCHQEPLFTDQSYRNNGMTLNPVLKDYGRMRITGKKEDSLKFKVPSLRNVYQTFPYGHDGRLYSLDIVLNHYSNGIAQSATLDPLLKNGIPLSSEEKYYIKIFLGTLSDSTFINDKRFAKP
ncbi:MAG: cytochrome-c peroxidase [Chitinophagaceae bacterium]